MQSRTIITLLLAAAFGLSGIHAGTASDANADPCDITVQAGENLQSAVTAAPAGSVVCIEAGVYTGTVSFAKPLTLQGASRDSVIIDASGTNQRGISVTASSGSSDPIDGITIRSLTVFGPGSGASFGVHIFNVENLLVEDVVVKGSSRSELDLHGVQNGIIRDSSFQGQDTSGTGLQMTDSHGILVQNVQTAGNTWGGMGIFAGGCCMPVKGTSDVTVAPGSTFAETVQVYTQTHQGATVTGLDTGDLRYRIDADLSTTHVFYNQDAAAALAFAASLPGATVLDLETGAYLVGPGMTIQKAVAAAPAGGTVRVQAGTYPFAATLSLAKPVTLVGPNEGVAAGDGGRGPEAVITSADPDNPVRRALRVATDDPGVTIDGFTFENAGTAIWVNGAQHVKDLTVGHNVFTGNNEAFGTSAAAPQHPNQIEGVAFVNNLVENNTGRAFSHYTGVRGTDFVLTGNEIRGSPGIYLGFVDGAQVSGNNITTASSGVFLADDIANVDVTGNQVDGSGVGLYVWEKTNVLGPIVVTDNLFAGLQTGISINEAAEQTTDVSNWTVLHNQFEGNGVGVFNGGTGVLDARFNWWGDVTGPLVLGDSVLPQGAVKVTPWCVDAACAILEPAEEALLELTGPLPV